MKTLFTLIIISFALSAMCQVTPKKQDSKVAQDDLYYIPKSKSLNAFGAEADKNQTDHIITCLDNYHKERTTALYIGIGGMAVASSSVFATGDAATGLLVAGGVGVLTSAAMLIHAERWMSRKNLTFTGNGLALKF